MRRTEVVNYTGFSNKEALEVIEAVFPDRTIEPINVNEVAEQGGLLNCITWTVLE